MTVYESAPCEKCGGTLYYKKHSKCVACIEAFKKQKRSKAMKDAFAKMKDGYQGRKATKQEFEQAMRSVKYEDEPVPDYGHIVPSKWP